MIFDSHTHLNAKEFEQDIDEVIERAKQLHVTKFAVVGFDKETILRSMKLSNQYEEIYSIIGWHPTEAQFYTKQNEALLYQLLDQPKVVAMGEMGLDYYWKTSHPDVQKKVFRRQIAIAKEFNLPISIHNRDATEDVYKILKEENISDIGGIMHSFNGNIEFMKKFLDLGMHISFSGVVTFKNAPEVRECALNVPKEWYLVETDAPYLAPVPYRGKRNEPGYTHYVVKKISEVRNESFKQVAMQTMINAKKLFRLE